MIVNGYLSFDNFERNDLEELLRLSDKDFLIKPIIKNKKYSKEVGIKGFRPESYKKSVIINIYIKEIITEKSKSCLGHYLLKNADELIKQELNDLEYQLLSEKKYESTELEKIMNKLFQKGSIDNKSLVLMLALNKDLEKKYLISSFEMKIKNLDEQIKNKNELILELKNELDKNIQYNNKLNMDGLKGENEELLNESKMLKSKNESLIAEITKLKCDKEVIEKQLINSNEKNKELYDQLNSSAYLGCLNENKLLEIIFEKTNNMNPNAIQKLYKDLKLKNIDNYLSIFYEKKLELFNKTEYNLLSDLIFVEYILTKLKEIENYGK